MIELLEARTPAEVERLRPLWGALGWQREEAELDYLLTRTQSRPGAVPFALVVTRAGEPVAGAAGRLERRPLGTAFGYRAVYAPAVRVLQLVDGGIASADAEALTALVRALERELRRGAAEALAVPALPLESAEFAALAGAGGRLHRQALIRAWPRRRLLLPESFDAFLGGLSRKSRFGVRYDAKKLLEAYGDDVSVSVLDRPEHLDRLLHDLETIAASAYQRALGAGFDSAGEQRVLAELGLARGWWRAYVLSIADRPVAYWLCSTYHETMLLRTTGYDPAYRQHRVGIYLLMKAIEDACNDPQLRIVDFGPGDDPYKRHFSNDAVEERNSLIYAPTARALRINAMRTGILGAHRLGKTALEHASLGERARREWRNRIRGAR